MNPILITISLLISIHCLADNARSYFEVNDPIHIAHILTKITSDENKGNLIKSGSQYDLTAVSLAGIQVLKIEFKDSSSDGKLCAAHLTFNHKSLKISFLGQKTKSALLSFYCK